MEQLSKEEVLYDEHEERLKKTKARRRRTIRRRHRLHLIIALGIVLLILPMVVLYLFCQRYFVESIERSGLVG